MKANKETLNQKIGIIDENMEYLTDKKSADFTDADFGELQAVKHCMFEIAEACIDIASHIIAAEGFEKPDDYSETFPVLADNKVIEPGLAENLEDMARFRNFLVHRYGEVRSERLEEFIEEDLEDVREFTSAIYSYME